MNTNKIGRRQLIITAAGAGLGTLLSRRALAQPATGDTAPTAQEAGDLHEEKLTEISNALGGTKIISEDGLTKLVDYLVKLGLISADDAKILKDVIQVIFHSETLDAMEKKIASISGKLKEDAENIALALVNITRSSIAYAKKLGVQIPIKTIVKIVADDFQGGLSAATVAAKLPPPWRVVVIVGGALSSSAQAVFGGESQPTKR
jgi:polyhydroxyalkanoate synthesis regulator phasin